MQKNGVKYNMNIIIKWLTSSLIIMVAGYLLPGVHISSFTSALAIALVLGILNLIVRPILIVLTLPLTIITLGLFLLVINGILIILTSSLVPGFEVDNFGWALLYSILISVVNMAVFRLFGSNKK
jgi:putative membrane protein